MQNNSQDIEKDYSLCFNEQFSSKPIVFTNYHDDGKSNFSLINGLENFKSTQNSSILTSICLDSELTTEVVPSKLSPNENQNNGASLCVEPDPDCSLIESELFFQENENETGDFNFTKITELADESKFIMNNKKQSSYEFTSSNQTLDEATYKDVTQKSQDSVETKESTEVETVKHKLTNLWNNVKYGWAAYLKKPNKISLENGPIYIMGKRFNSPNQFERSISDTCHNITHSNSQKPGESLPYDFIDANKLGSLNESYIYPSIPINPKNNTVIEYDETSTGRQILSVNSNEFLSLASSPPISTSPFSVLNNPKSSNNRNKSDYFVIDDISASMTASVSYKSTASADYMQLQYLNPQKTSLEKEIHSRIWFTYRKDFAPLNGNLKYTSDCGWGCMLRSAQMLIAQGLLHHYFGKGWSLYNKLKSHEYHLYKEILSLFNDRLSKNCPFGIHRLLEVADQKRIGNPNLENVQNQNSSSSGSRTAAEKLENASRVGSWFGPTSVCLLMKEALDQSPASNLLLNNLQIYVAQDCTIYKQDVLNLCTRKIEGICKFTPCIILVSVRLGGEEMNEIYKPSLKMFLEMDSCIGMIGGKPKHSLYFFGYQGDKVIYLDPHFCQPTVNIFSTNDHTIITTSSHSSLSSSKHSYDDTTSPDYEIFDNSSFHCENPSKAPFSKLDPSLAIGFFCSSYEDLNKLCDFTKMLTCSKKIFPIFGVSDESYEKSQCKYQILCDEDVFTESPTFSVNQKPESPAIPILNQNRNSKIRTGSHSKSQSRSFNGIMNSLPKKFDKLLFEKHETSNSEKKSSSLAEKFARSKQSKKKSDTDDFVLI